MTAEIRIGTQGWNYSAWVGPFYPVGTRGDHMLATYARAFTTVEVDSTFYAIPPEPVVRTWCDHVPDDFRFSLKVPQEITHERRLVDVADPLARFLERASLLGDRLGVLLLQMAPDWAPTPAARAALEDFVRVLPGDFRWAIEFRDQRWLAAETIGLLQAGGVAVTMADGRWIRRDRLLTLLDSVTAEFAYVRWMGADRRITDYSRVQIDRAGELDEWAVGLRRLAGRVRTIYGYVNNHYQGHSPQSARDLQARLGQAPVDPVLLREQVELFETG